MVDDLREQRQQNHVQRALQDALERAMESSYDAQSLVETLFDNGAEAAGVFLPDLFRKMRNDSFGFCDDLREGRFKDVGLPPDARSRRRGHGVMV